MQKHYAITVDYGWESGILPHKRNPSVHIAPLHNNNIPITFWGQDFIDTIEYWSKTNKLYKTVYHCWYGLGWYTFEVIEL